MAESYGDLKPYSSLPPRLNPLLKPKDANDVKPAKAGKEPVMINMQLTLYDIQITEIKKRITRLEDRNEEVEEECEVIEVATNATDTETADDISRITKLVRTEQTKVDDLKEKIESIETMLKEETKKHNKKAENLNEKYNRKRLSLLSKIKVLNAKINALEDFKRTQPLLQEKLEKMATFMAEEQERIKLMLEKIERKFRLDREKLKKDMYNRLLGYAGTFQIEVSKCMSPPVHRLLRENLMLRRDLNKIGKMYPSKEELALMIKAAESKYQDIITASISEARKNMIAIKIQTLLINLLKEKNEKAKEQLSLTFDKLEKTENEKEIAIKINDALRNSRLYEATVQRLGVSLHQERGTLSSFKYTWKKIHCNVKRALETLFDLKFIVNNALQYDVCLEITRDKSERLIPRLLSALDKTMPLLIESTHTIRGASTAYIIGDLGFEPKSIPKMEEPRILENDFIRKFTRISESGISEEEENPDDIPQVVDVLLEEGKEEEKEEDEGEEGEEWEGNEDFERYLLEVYETTDAKNRYEDEDGEIMGE